MGLFAGLSLQGSSLSIDPLPNQSLYNQEKVTANDIFYGKLKTTAPAASQLKMLLEDSSS
jgi:lipid-binding SYLF domain-containing protein